MALIGMDSVTIVDLTDGYTVNMSPESYAFPAGTTNALSGSVNTVIEAFQGETPVAATVTLANVTAPSGITVTKDTNVTTPTLTITITTSVTQPGVVVVPVVVGDITVTKRFAFSLAKTGSTGTSGTSPVNVTMGNDSIAIPTNSSGSTTAASSVTIPFGTYAGTSRVAGTVAVSGLPTGITAGTNTAATTSADGSLTLNIANASTLGGTNSGNITLTFTLSGQTIVKYFSWAKALAGTAGSSGVSSTNVIVGTEDTSIPSTPAGLTAAASSIVIPFAGYIGATRAAATVAVGTLPSGMTVGTNTAATASADGSLTINVASGATLGAAETRSGTFTLTFTCNSQTFTRYFSWSKALAGTDGANGADAIVLAVTSSNGTIFKNTAVATTLTARVYKGGVEQTAPQITALGTVSWYKDGNATPVGTGTTLVLDAGQVTNKAVYEARLETA